MLLKKLQNILHNNEIIKKGSSALFFKLLGGLFGYIFLLLVTRISGADVWGIFALCLAVLHMSSIVGILGIDLTLVKYIATFRENLSKVKRIYLQGIKIATISSLCVAVFVYFFADIIASHIFNKPYLSEYLRVIAFAILPFALVNINAQSLRGLKRITEFATYQHLLRFLLPVIFFFFIINYTGFDVVISPLYAFLFSVILMLILSTVHFNKIVNSDSYWENIISNSELFKTAFPMMFSASILLIMAWADTIMIGIFIEDTGAVGIYNGAFRVAMITGVILGAINSIVAPKISETYNRNNINEFKKVVKYSTRIIFITTIPIVLVLFIFPEFVLSFLGEEFMHAKTVLLILLVGKFVSSISGSVGVILQMTGYQKAFQNILLISLIFNIILNLILIPKYGIEGAAIASTFSIILWNISSVIFIRKKFKIWTFFTL